MIDDVLINKSATIERCIARVRKEYQKNPAGFSEDYTRQDAAILNIQRACEAALDIGSHLVRQHKLGVPQSARDIFQLLQQAQLIPVELSEQLQHMVGFRNIAVHDYQQLQLPIIIAIIEKHLDNFLSFTQLILKSQTS